MFPRNRVFVFFFGAEVKAPPPNYAVFFFSILTFFGTCFVFSFRRLFYRGLQGGKHDEKNRTPRTDDRFPLHGIIDLLGRTDVFPILHDLDHVSGWEPYDLYDLRYHMFPGLDLYYSDPAEPLTAAG